MLESSKNVDVIYLDFEKAFNKVDFAVGIIVYLFKCIRSFFTNRTHVIVVNGARLQQKIVVSEVLQGPVLGSLPFLILISKIDEEVSGSFVSRTLSVIPNTCVKITNS